MSNRFRNTMAMLILCIIGYGWYSKQGDAPVIVPPVVLQDALNETPAAAAPAKKPKKKKSKSVSTTVQNDLRDALNNLPSTEDPTIETANSAAGDLSALGTFGDGFGDPPGTNPTQDPNHPPNNQTISPSQPNQNQEFPQ